MLVGSLLLFEDEIKGAIPTEFGRLTMMQQLLCVHMNQLSQSMPTQLGELAEVTTHTPRNHLHWSHFVPRFPPPPPSLGRNSTFDFSPTIRLRPTPPRPYLPSVSRIHVGVF